MRTVLLLAGTAEARALAARLAGMPGLSPVASLAGVTTAPHAYAIPVRQGGFGGVEGLMRWLSEHRCTALLDATHPYATVIHANARQAATRLSLPHLRLLRPPWPVRPGWVTAPDAATAAALLPAGARALLTSGRKELAPFLARTDVALVLRTIEPVEALPGHVESVLAPPGKTAEAEATFLRERRITHLVTRNSGGIAMAKLDAAQALRLTTVVIDRPPPPPGETVATVDEAVAWVRRTVANAP